MELNDYQNRAMSTCMDSCMNISYMLLNLQAEVGEFSGKVAKHIRKDEAGIDCNRLYFDSHNMQDEYFVALDHLQKEAGDILWQLSGLCKVMGWSLEEVAQQNLKKLASRKDRGVIAGNGDDR